LTPVLVFYETFAEFGLELKTGKPEIMMQKATQDEERESPKIYIDKKLLQVINSNILAVNCKMMLRIAQKLSMVEKTHFPQDQN
jgi:hypothetical protein